MEEIEQLKLPLAIVLGQPVVEVPKGLYIPPNALKVLLTDFEGPLDLLSYLIRANKFDVLDIPVFEVARQYQAYISMMQQMDIELAGEYLFMAAWLTEIKSRLLLPKPPVAEDDEAVEEDPRAELVKKLIEYEAYQQAAQWLDSVEVVGRDIWPVYLEVAPPVSLASVEWEDLVTAMQSALQRALLVTAHQVVDEPIEITDKIEWVLLQVEEAPKSFVDLLVVHEGRTGLVVTFMALLELWRQRRIQLEQITAYQDIQVRRVNGDI